jgi:hypothetical protein
MLALHPVKNGGRRHDSADDLCKHVADLPIKSYEKQ